MIQKERQKRRRQEILLAAIAEFGSHEYGEVNMENICKRHGISKGMMYHYFANKDDLFLYVVEDTFQGLYKTVEQGVSQCKEKDVKEGIQSFFMLRESYFAQNPDRIRIFETAVLRPPVHLKENIKVLWEPLRTLNRTFIRDIVASMPLRPGIDKEHVTRYFESVEPVFRTILVRYLGDDKPRDVHALFEASGEVLDMFLAGVVKQ